MKKWWIELDEVVQSVMHRLEESSEGFVYLGESSVDGEGLPLENLIREYVPMVARQVTELAPMSYFTIDDTRGFEHMIRWEKEVGLGSGVIELPIDFFRLWSFAMSDWERTVYEAVSPTSPQYKLLRSRVPGVGGTPQRPAVVITPAKRGWNLEFYSCKVGKEVFIREASYIPYPKIEGSKLFIAQKLKEALISGIALNVCRSMQDVQGIQIFTAQMGELLGGTGNADNVV